MSAEALKSAVTGQTPATREQTPYERFRDFVQKPAFVSDLIQLLGTEQRARVFVRVVLTAVQQTPKLLDVDRRTLLLACMKAARDKLMPDGKEAVLNIYRTKVKDGNAERYVDQAQYLPMAAGMIKKLYDSGLVTYVDAAAVYEGDHFEYERGDVTKLVHRPTLKDEPGPVIASYAVIKLANGETKREVMPRRDIEKVRAASSAPDGFGWKTWYDQFAIKSVIKRAYKQLPSAPELDQVAAHDNEAMGFPGGLDLNAESFSGAKPTDIQGTATADKAETTATPKAKALENNPAQGIPTKVTKEPAKEKVKRGADKAQEKPAKGSVEAFTYAEVLDKLERALDRESFDLAVDLIRHVPEQHRQELRERATALLLSRFGGDKPAA